MFKRLVVLMLVGILRVYAGVEVEPNGSYENAQIISNNETIYASVRRNNYDTDFYKFTAYGHAFNFSFSTTEENIDYYIYIYNQQREEIEHYTVHKGERGFNITLGVDPGTVYVKVQAGNYVGTDGDYQISISGLGENEISRHYEIQPNSRFTNAQLISQGIYYRGYINKNNYDTDMYKLRNIYGSIDLHFKTQEENIDYYIYVYDRQQHQLKYYHLNKGEMELYETIGVDTDTIYVKIQAGNYNTDGFGTYDIAINPNQVIIDPHPESCATTLLTNGAAAYDYLSAGCASNIRSGSYAKRYRLSLTQKSSVTINLSSDYVDTYLIVLDQYGQLIASNDDKDSGTDSQLVLDLNRGEYIVEATTYHPGSEGAFTLQYNSSNADVNITQTQNLQIPTLTEWNMLSDNLSTGRLMDNGKYTKQYRVNLSHPSRVVFYASSIDIDTFIVLYDRFGNKLTYDDDSAGGTDSMIDVDLESGEYIVEVTTYYEGETGNFAVGYYTY